jgi:hypothetical protein
VRFLAFLRAAGKRGVSLMTGGILSFAIALIEHLRGNSLTSFGFATVALGAVMVGAYFAWSAERDRADAAEVHKKELECPPGRPQLSFVRWSQPNQGYKSGFFLKNHGGVAVEIIIERFRLGRIWVNGNTTSEIGRNEEGLASVWLEASKFDQFSLDDALVMAQAELPQGQPLIVPISVIYRDFGNLWYRSECDVKFANNKSVFGSSHQTCLGLSKPKPKANPLPSKADLSGLRP